MPACPDLEPGVSPADAISGSVLIAGPTASGKSELALQLASHLGGEILSVDSMQVYRGLDTGTAKPSIDERRRVPHHLIDIVDLTASFDAAQFVFRARQALHDIRSRGRVPILCGGTGLYFMALLRGLGESPPADAGLRKELDSQPTPALLEDLAGRDPETFARIDRNNRRRVIRALEVIRISGRPYSRQRAAWDENRSLDDPVIRVGIEHSADSLRERIERRVDDMFARGLVEETRALLERGLADNRTALQAIGYRQVADHLQHGVPLDETLARVKQRTRDFAKRQRTWFRGRMRLEWMNPEGIPDGFQSLAAGIAARYQENARTRAAR